MSAPIPFPGSEEEAAANFATHSFAWDDGSDVRCWGCDSRPSYVAASYPCGAEVPRTET
jgi:hypothetical protein